MNAIDKVLKWAQFLQTSCFGTPIGITIEASRGVGSEKMIFITIATTEESKSYIISADMPSEQLYQKWGEVKNDASILLDKYVGRIVNKHGKVKQANE